MLPRPKTSSKGARTSGPKTKASTKMKSIILAFASEMRSACAMFKRAGASMVEDMRPPREERMMSVRFWARCQFAVWEGSVSIC